jgi:hypothetical protein
MVTWLPGALVILAENSIGDCSQLSRIWWMRSSSGRDSVGDGHPARLPRSMSSSWKATMASARAA